MAAADPESNESARLAEHIRAERLRFVFVQSALPILFSPLAAAILAFVLRNVVPRTTLIAWTVLLTAIAAVRLGQTRRFGAISPEKVDVRRWERVFFISIMVVDLTWGLGAVFILPAGLTERALVFSFVMLMAGGHTASYSAHPSLVIAGDAALTAPLTLLFALQRDAFHSALAFVAIMYLAAAFRSIRTLGYFFNRTHRLAHELEQERDRAERLARSDFLTSLFNRRAFYESGERLVSEARERHDALSLLILDIDHFKQVNDEYGHAVGDAVIRQLAAVIREVCRPHDVAGRLGGEEFGVLLPSTPLRAAAALAEALRAAVAAGGATTGDGTPQERTIRFTVSVGVAEASAEKLDDVLAAADEALYEAKRAGRNRVVAHPSRPADLLTV